MHVIKVLAQFNEAQDCDPGVNVKLNNNISYAPNYATRSHKIDGIASALGKIRFGPLLLAEVYLTGSVLFFAFGPWPWPVADPVLLYELLILYQVAFGIGYLFSANRPQKMSDQAVATEKSYERMFLIAIFVISFLFILPDFQIITGAPYRGDITQFIPSLIQSLNNSGAAYQQKVVDLWAASSISDRYSSLIIILSWLVAPLRWLMIPLGVKLWKKLSIVEKVFLILFPSLNTLIWLSVGTNKGVFDNLLLVLASVAIFRIASPNRTKPLLTRRQLLVIGITVIVGIVFFLDRFSYNIESRGAMTEVNHRAQIAADSSQWYFQVFPQFSNLFLSIGAYWTQGYYGMSLALQEDFTPTWGIGNSYYLTGLFGRFFGGTDAVVSQTYPSKIQKYGWDMYGNWHTAYTWFASDISFYGVAILMFFLGFYFSELWKDVLYRCNIISIGQFIMMLMLIFYLPANNQVFAFPQTCVSFIALFAVQMIQKLRQKKSPWIISNPTLHP